MRPAALVLVLGACLRAQTSGFEGTATNSLNHEPLAGVHVQLVLRGRGDVTAVYGAISDNTGHFSMARMPGGTYMLNADLRGFIYVPKSADSDSRSVTLKAGEPTTGFQLEMTPHAVITGRVLTENGDPLSGIQVQAEPSNPENAQGFPGMFSPPTDDRGRFRFSGPPGKYYIKAAQNVNPSMGMMRSREIRLDGSVDPVYQPTYYPSGSATAQAAPVEVAAGAEVTGIDIRMLTQAVPLSISGTVTGMPAGVAAVLNVNWGETPDRAYYGTGAMVDREGKFELKGIQPGYYRIHASASGKVRLESPILELKLDNTPVTNLELALAPGSEISGAIELAGEPRGSKLPGKPVVRLEATLTQSVSGAVDAQGAFRINDVFPEKYRLMVDSLPENAFLQAVRLDDAPVEGRELDFSHGVHNSYLKLIVNRHGAEISGVLLDKEGKPLENPAGAVYLVENGKEIAPNRPPDHYARVAGDGKYVLHAIAPGKYRIVAFSAAAIGRTQDGFKKLLALGEPIEFKESDRITKNLKLLTKEDLNAKP
jgi:hypothetical protein